MEFTFRALFLGLLLALLLGAANAYLGLKVGMTVSASIPAAVLSFAVLRWFRTANILENNLVQTAASAGEALAAGMIFTLPALIFLGSWNHVSYIEGTLLITLGGILGVLLAVPLRRVLISQSELTFPEGVATAQVLKAGYAQTGAIRALLEAGLLAALFKLLQSGLGMAASSVSFAFQHGKWLTGFGADLSPALIAVGYIVRMRIASLMFIGGVLVWTIAMPLYTFIYPPARSSESAINMAFDVWSEELRFIGVGAMLVAGLWVLILAMKPVWRSIHSSLFAPKPVRQQMKSLEEFSLERVIAWIAIIVFPVAVLLYRMIPYHELLYFGLPFTFIASFLFSTVAAYMAGLVGSSNNPISGVTIATILIAALFIFFMLGGKPIFYGYEGVQKEAAGFTIIIGAIVCCAAAIAGDTMQDLKAGQIVGASPRLQTWMQLLGVVTAGLVLVPILTLLYEAYGFAGHMPRAGMDASQALAAPQASLIQTVVIRVFSISLSWGLILIGMALAVIIILIDLLLKSRMSTIRIPVMAIAVGMYLPITLSSSIFIGGMVAHAVRKMSVQSQLKGTLFASGLIAGEALIGIVLAIPFALLKDTTYFYIFNNPSQTGTGLIGIALTVIVCYMLYRSVAQKKGTDLK